MFSYVSKYKWSKGLFACLCMKVCKHVYIQGFDADHSGNAL